MKDEIADKVVWRSHPAKMSHLKDFVLGIILLPILVGLYFLCRAFINIYSTEYSITTKTIAVKTGLFSVRKTEIRIADIIARSADKQAVSRERKKQDDTPKIAYVDRGNIYIEPITKEVLGAIEI